MPQNSGGLTADSLGFERMSAILTDSSVPKIVVGREPISRLRSAYKSRVKVHTQDPLFAHHHADWIALRQQILGWKMGAHAVSPDLAISEEITFQDLAQYVASTPSWELDRHYIPQTYFAAVDHIKYDLIGQVERLDEFLSEFCKLVGRSKLQVPEGYRLNSSVGASEGLILEEPVRSALVQRYAADYEFFGYEAS